MEDVRVGQYWKAKAPAPPGEFVFKAMRHPRYYEHFNTDRVSFQRLRNGGRDHAGNLTMCRLYVLEHYELCDCTGNTDDV